MKKQKQERPQRESLRSSLNYRETRRGPRLLAQDIRELFPAVCAVLLYAVLTHLLFDRFCPMLILTDLPCPGCGMTRAFFLVLTGRFGEAWRLQPPVYGWILLGAAFAARRYGPWKRGAAIRGRERSFWRLALALCLCANMGLYGWRLLHGFPEGLIEPGRMFWEEILRRTCAYTSEVLH